MKLKFAHREINEYVDGPLHFKNDGSVIDVAPSQAQIMLAARHPINGKDVAIFTEMKTADEVKSEK